MTPNRSALRVLLLGLLPLAVLIGCGGEETPSPAPAEPQAAQPAQPMESGAPDESAAAEEPAPIPGATHAANQLRHKVELPDDYPDDAPVYPGTQPSQVSRTADGRIVVMFGTEDSPEQVMDFLTGYLPGAGWDVSGEQDLPTGKLVQGTKGGRVISVVLSRLDEGRESAITMIAVSVDS